MSRGRPLSSETETMGRNRPQKEVVGGTDDSSKTARLAARRGLRSLLIHILVFSIYLLLVTGHSVAGHISLSPPNDSTQSLAVYNYMDGTPEKETNELTGRGEGGWRETMKERYDEGNDQYLHALMRRLPNENRNASGAPTNHTNHTPAASPPSPSQSQPSAPPKATESERKVGAGNASDISSWAIGVLLYILGTTFLALGANLQRYR